MAYSTTVRTKFKAPDFSGVVNASVISRVQEEVIERNIKASIRVGLSPVQGFGRFVGYKDPEKYPAEEKPSRPVNLELSSEMLSWLRAKIGSGGKSLTVGIHSDAPDKVRARAEGNNTGSAKGVAVRRFIPLPGEKFKVSTITILRKIFSDRIMEMLRRR